MIGVPNRSAQLLGEVQVQERAHRGLVGGAERSLKEAGQRAHGAVDQADRLSVHKRIEHAQREERDRVEAESGALLLQRLEADGRGELQVEDTDQRDDQVVGAGHPQRVRARKGLGRDQLGRLARRRLDQAQQGHRGHLSHQLLAGDARGPRRAHQRQEHSRHRPTRPGERRVRFVQGGPHVDRRDAQVRARLPRRGERDRVARSHLQLAGHLAHAAQHELPARVPVVHSPPAQADLAEARLDADTGREQPAGHVPSDHPAHARRQRRRGHDCRGQEALRRLRCRHRGPTGRFARGRLRLGLVRRRRDRVQSDRRLAQQVRPAGGEGPTGHVARSRAKRGTHQEGSRVRHFARRPLAGLGEHHLRRQRQHLHQALLRPGLAIHQAKLEPHLRTLRHRLLDHSLSQGKPLFLSICLFNSIYCIC